MIFPDGKVFTHKKDIPTQFENCYYTRGDTDHILHTPMGITLEKFIGFLEQLEKHKIYYTISKTREDYIRVNIAVPGERWEVEFSGDGDIVVERFKSSGNVEGEEAIKYLFDNFSD